MRTLANRVDQDEMPHFAGFHLGLHCLLRQIRYLEKETQYSFGSELPVTPRCKQWTILTYLYEPWHEISNNVVCATSKGSDQPAHMRSLIRALASRLNII